MIFLYPYRGVRVTASVRDEFVRDERPATLDPHPMDRQGIIEGSFLNGILTFWPYDYRADRPVSRTSRGWKRLGRLLNGRLDECKFYGTAAAFKQIGMDVTKD